MLANEGTKKREPLFQEVLLRFPQFAYFIRPVRACPPSACPDFAHQLRQQAEYP